MRRSTSTAVVMLLVSTSLYFSQNAGSRSAWNSLVETEREFATTSAAKGTRVAFLAFLAEDSILFRPNPVPGKKWVEEHPSSPGLLTWEPAFAEVASSGDLGYTTGPWELRRDGPNEKPAAYGQYVTVWKKQEDGAWKAVLDLGISHQAPNSPAGTVQSPKESRAGSVKSKLNRDPEAERTGLLKIERELGRAMSERGTAQAYLRYLAEDARIYRMKAFPIVAKREVFAALSQKSGKVSFQPEKAEVSGFADLGYVYGTSKFTSEASNEAAPVSSNYVRIWRRVDGKWQIVLDIENPFLTPTSGSGNQPAQQ
jgi:ketosteroid isomerase-like protein